MYRAQGLCIPLFFVFPLLLASSLQGQATCGNGSGSSTASFIKNFDEVSIDFAVRNKKKSVPDLKPEDVVIRDEGSVVKLSDLRLVTGKSGANHLITLLFDPLDRDERTRRR
jgi:hypothetical protein